MNPSNGESAAPLPPFPRWFASKPCGKTPAGCAAGSGNPQQTMEPSFEKLLVILAEARVDFVIVGGVAVTLHGYIRLTEDHFGKKTNSTWPRSNSFGQTRTLSTECALLVGLS